MGQVIVVTSAKSGAGKTVVTANLGTALAQRGNRVVLVDAVLGLPNLDVFLGLENRIVYDMVDVIEGHARLEQALIKDKRIDNLYLLDAARTREQRDVSPRQMRDLTQQLALQFDFVLIDCPPGIADGFKNAIAGAQKAIFVCLPLEASVRNADRVIGLWDAKGEEMSPVMLVVNRYHPKLAARGDYRSIDDMLEMLVVDLLGIVPEDDHVSVSINRGESAVYHRESTAGQASTRLARRLMGENVPIADFTPETWWRKARQVMGWGQPLGSPPPATCWQCSRPLLGTAATCTGCGADVQGIPCHTCRRRMPAKLTHCGYCGTKLSTKTG